MARVIKTFCDCCGRDIGKDEWHEVTIVNKVYKTGEAQRPIEVITYKPFVACGDCFGDKFFGVTYNIDKVVSTC